MAKYVDILFRHRIRFLLLFIVLPLELATACVFLYPHESAATSLWVETPWYISISPQSTGWNQYLTPAQNTMDSMNQLTDTGAFAHTLGVALDKMNTFQDQAERDTVLGSLSSDLRISTAGSHLVVLTFTCPRRQICIDVLNTTVQIYRDWMSTRTVDQAAYAKTFYQGELTDAQAALRDDSNKLDQWRKANPRATQLEMANSPEYQDLSRAVSLDESQIQALKSKLASVDLASSAAQQVVDISLKTMDPPRVVGGRLSALPRKQMLIAGGIGLAIALIVLVVMAWLDRTVREPQELEHRLKLRVVTTIADLAAASEQVA